ncbi:7864_t:CDS:2, partial [Diversispora eburnea]
MDQEETIIIKARCNVDEGQVARKIVIDKNIKLEELEYKLRERFDVSYDKRVELYYLDEQDHIAVTFEDELALAMESSKVPIFELVVKQKAIDGFYTYPKVSKGKPGDVFEVLVESQWLTITNATRDDTKAWGTFIYTDDSDVVKALAHTEKVELTDIPPEYNVIATVRFLPGCLKYYGSSCQGITTMSFGPYISSFIIEEVRVIAAPSYNEKSYS